MKRVAIAIQIVGLIGVFGCEVCFRAIGILLITLAAAHVVLLYLTLYGRSGFELYKNLSLIGLLAIGCDDCWRSS